MARDLASFMNTGDSDWNEHVALACFRYNTGICTATGTTPYKAAFGIGAFEAWGELDLDRNDGEPDSLSERLSVFHKQLLGRARKERNRAKTQYDKSVRETQYEMEEGKKVVKPWIGPYIVSGKLGRVGYQMLSEMGNTTVRVHANRQRKIAKCMLETGDPEIGMIPDSLRTLKRISGAEVRRNAETGEQERWFNMRIKGRRSRV